MNANLMNTTKEHILRGLDANVRLDGRKKEDYRAVSIEYDVSKSAEGSARVRCGQTEVLAGVKMAIEEPYPDTPDKGNLMVNAELSPLSSPEFETGPPSDWGIEVARITDRGIRESHALMPSTLCIESGKAVWSVSVDVVPICDSGNLLDMAGLVSIAALSHAHYPGVKDGNADYGTRTDKKLKLESTPLPVTVWAIGKHFIIDPLPEEEKAADARLTITTTADGTIVALQKGGSMPLKSEQINDMVKLALRVAKDLRHKLH